MTNNQNGKKEKLGNFDLSFIKVENFQEKPKKQPIKATSEKERYRNEKTVKSKTKKGSDWIFMLFILIAISLNIYIAITFTLSAYKPILFLIVTILLCRCANIRIYLIENILKRLGI